MIALSSPDKVGSLTMLHTFRIHFLATRDLLRNFVAYLDTVYLDQDTTFKPSMSNCMIDDRSDPSSPRPDKDETKEAIMSACVVTRVATIKQ